MLRRCAWVLAVCLLVVSVTKVIYGQCTFGCDKIGALGGADVYGNPFCLEFQVATGRNVWDMAAPHAGNFPVDDNGGSTCQKVWHRDGCSPTCGATAQEAIAQGWVPQAVGVGGMQSPSFTWWQCYKCVWK